MECQLKNINVYYEVYGEGTPIVLLHGWTMNSHFMKYDFEPIFEGRESWQRIYLDLPGHGRTAAEEWITNQDQMLEVVLDFIDQVIPGQRFAIAGVSLGAYLARGVILRKRRLIDGLLMIVPVIVAEDAKRTLPPRTVLIEDPEIMAELRTEEKEMLEMVVIRSRKLFENLRSYPPPPADAEPDQVFLDRIRQRPENYTFSFNVDALPEPIVVPTLIVAGRQDHVVGYQDAWNLLAQYPRATFVVLDRAGHILEEKEEVVRVLVNEWLDRVDEYQKMRQEG